MENIVFGFYIFLDFLSILLLIDVILSWLGIFGINIRPKFLSSLFDPLYDFIKSIIPTTIGPFDFTVIILMLLISFLKGFVIIFFPNIKPLIDLYTSFF